MPNELVLIDAKERAHVRHEDRLGLALFDREPDRRRGDVTEKDDGAGGTFELRIDAYRAVGGGTELCIVEDACEEDVGQGDVAAKRRSIDPLGGLTPPKPP